jgi:hypothetical protein
MSEDLAEKGRDYIRLHGRGGFVDGLISAMAARISELERALRDDAETMDSVQSFLVGNGDVADLAARRLRERLYATDAVLEKKP